MHVPNTPYAPQGWAPHKPYFNWWMPLWAAVIGGFWGGVPMFLLAPALGTSRAWTGLEIGVVAAWAAWYALVNIAAIALYGWDKLAAIEEWPRLSENTLIWISALGAFPGAAIASALWGHKTIDRLFLTRRGIVTACAAFSFATAVVIGFAAGDAPSWIERYWN